MPELVISGFEKLLNGLEIQLPSVLRKMAFNVDANVASEGRKREQKTAHTLQMGQLQVKGMNSLRRSPKVFSRWDPKVGWVSTSRMAAKGGTGFRMASFGWERAKKASVTAPYSNQLANLWHRETDPYMRNSPIVGRPGKLTMWREGARRPVRNNWSTAYNILASVEDVAIARTEKQFQPKLDKEVFK